MYDMEVLMEKLFLVLKWNVDFFVRYGYVLYLGLLYFLMMGGFWILLENDVLVRIYLREGFCCLFLMICEVFNIFFMFWFFFRIGRLFLMMLNIFGFLGLCVEMYGIIFLMGLILIKRRFFCLWDLVLLILFWISCVG